MERSNLSKDAIIGCAFNYNTRAIAPFLNSLEQANFTGDLILFINNKSDIEIDKYTYNVVLINPDKDLAHHNTFHRYWYKVSRKLRLEKLFKRFVFNEVKKTVSENRGLSNWLTSFFYTRYHLMTSRFFLYYYFLKGKAFENILFTDVGDVVFQSQPLLFSANDCVYAFSENPDFTISKEEFTESWIREGFGPEILEIMKDEPVYCAGTIISKNEVTITFLRDFLHLIVEFDISPVVDGIDQGVFNYMITYLKKPYFSVNQNGEHVFTMGLLKQEEIILADNKFYLKGNEGRLPGILHQYNRHVNLTNFIQDHYNSTVAK
jgi:hypothetical protein